MTPANFDRVARAYRWLEHAAFGTALQRARLVHLHHLRDRRNILLLGDGDGRALARILAVAPSSLVLSVDASPRMLELASRRIPEADRNRVTLHCADARTVSLLPQSIDAVVTQFFLDCFTSSEMTAIVNAVTPAVRSGGLWLFADFVLPPGGARRVLASTVVSALYAFFRWSTGITARALPASEKAITRAGFVAVEDAVFVGGLIHSVVFTRSPIPAVAQKPPHD